MSSDKAYLETKLIKQGKATLPAEFQPFADWIDETFGVKPLHVLYELAEIIVPPEEYSEEPRETVTETRPRVSLIFESYKDTEVFNRKGMPSQDPDKMEALESKFKELYAKSHKTDRMFFVLNDFAGDAQFDVIYALAPAEVEQLEKEIACPQLWKIYPHSPSVTFFFYTELQAADARRRGTYTKWADMYYSMLKEHDEFDLLNRRSFTVKIESKEKFDTYYQGSWYNYDISS